MKYTYQQTVTVIQLTEDCIDDIQIRIKENKDFGITYLRPEGVIYIDTGINNLTFALNGNYLAITDNHCWVMTPDEVIVHEVKEVIPWETIPDEPERIC